MNELLQKLQIIAGSLTSPTTQLVESNPVAVLGAQLKAIAHDLLVLEARREAERRWKPSGEDCRRFLERHSLDMTVGQASVLLDDARSMHKLDGVFTSSDTPSSLLPPGYVCVKRGDALQAGDLVSIDGKWEEVHPGHVGEIVENPRYLAVRKDPSL